MRLPPATQRSVKRLAAATRSDRADLLTLAAIAIAVVWANISPRSYREVWKATTVWSRPLGLELSVQDWVSQGLMVAFFMLVGLEIRREIANGQLRSWRRASVPIVAAICGMALPAAIYALVVGGSAGGHGWGIPMATDVAFALGALGLVQPGSSRLRVFLLTLAVADDIASILIPVFVYSPPLHTSMLVLSLGCLGTMAALSALGIRRVWPLIVLGPLAWWALARAGVEPAVVGVAIGLVVPTPTGHGARALKGLDPGPGRLELALEPW